MSQLYDLLTEKENIMGRDYTLISENDANLASEISSYLGYAKYLPVFKKTIINKIE